MFPHPGVQKDYSEGEKDIFCGNNVEITGVEYSEEETLYIDLINWVRGPLYAENIEPTGLGSKQPNNDRFFPRTDRANE